MIRLTSSSPAASCSGSAPAPGPGPAAATAAVQVAAAGEHPSAAEHLRQVGGQQVVTPGDGVPQGLLPRRLPDVGGGQVQAGPEPGQQGPGGEQPGPGCGQLDRQRQPVQVLADGSDVGGVAFGHGEARPGHGRLLHEQPRRAARRHLLQPRLARHLQRRHRQLLLTGQVQQPPRRRQHPQARSGREQLRHHRGGPVQLLQVVQPQQRLAITQVPGHRVGGRPVAHDVQAVGDHLPHHPRIAHRRQSHEKHPVPELLTQRHRGGQRQPRLADTAGAGQRHQPHPRPDKRSADVLQVALGVGEPVGADQHAAAAASFPTRPDFPPVEIGMATGRHPGAAARRCGGRRRRGQGEADELAVPLGLLTAVGEEVLMA